MLPFKPVSSKSRNALDWGGGEVRRTKVIYYSHQGVTWLWPLPWDGFCWFACGVTVGVSLPICAKASSSYTVQFPSGFLVKLLGRLKGQYSRLNVSRVKSSIAQALREEVGLSESPIILLIKQQLSSFLVCRTALATVELKSAILNY